MRIFTRYIMTMMGFLGFGVFLHELYHAIFKKTVSSVCLQFGGNAVAYVTGKGSTSEIWAYSISTIVTLIGIVFATYDFFKTKDLK